MAATRSITCRAERCGYYGRAFAYKVQFTIPETRALIYEFVAARGEKQFFIRDSDDRQSLEAKIIALGGNWNCGEQSMDTHTF